MSYILTFLLFFSGLADKENCKSIKKGVFKTVNENGTDNPFITIIERTEKFQYERCDQLGVELKFRIEWLDDCIYKLTWLETIKDENNFGYPKNQILTIEVTEVNSNYYNQIGSSNLFNGKVEGKVEILK